MTAWMTYFFLCNLLEKRYVIFIISWHCSLRGNFPADILRYLSWPALSRSWHLAASGMGLGIMSYQAGLLTTLHHIHICFPEQGGNMVTTMGWGFSDFRHLFCFTLLINKACMYHNLIPLMYIFNSPANECWVSFSFNHIEYKVTPKVARQIYYAFIFSRIQYEIEVYSSGSETHTNRLHVIQNKLLKLILWLDTLTATSTCYTKR